MQGPDSSEDICHPHSLLVWIGVSKSWAILGVQLLLLQSHLKFLDLLGIGPVNSHGKMPWIFRGASEVGEAHGQGDDGGREEEISEHNNDFIRTEYIFFMALR